MSYWSNGSCSIGLKPVRATAELTHKREVIDGLVSDRVVREIPSADTVPFLSRTLGTLMASGQPIDRVSSYALTEERFERINNINYVPRGTENEEE